jgi:membrane-bound metal-dependent hydrolase YbcI (DUF457 family)
MTTFEHAMLGANGVVASGLHHRFGWKLVVLAAVAAIAPDWDGLTVLVDASVFDRGHRVWGHNIFACCATGILVASLDTRFNLTGRLVAWLQTFRSTSEDMADEAVVSEQPTVSYSAAIVVAVSAALSQIPADAVVSGGQGLADWPVKYLWPVSNAEVIFPLVPWGDPGITIVFCVGMILAARFKDRVRPIAISTLIGVTGYILVRGLVFG